MPWAKRSTSSGLVEAPEAPGPPREIALRWMHGLQPYAATWDLQKRLHAERCAGRLPDQMLLLEHAPVVTVGRNGSAMNLVAPESLLRARGVDLVWTDRGGDVTYHGPGQLVGYLIVDLKELHQDVHRFLREIEEGLIRALARWGIAAERNPGRTGVWVAGEKIASIGLRVGHWVTMHGFALNVSTDLTAFDWIVPCGITGCRMTSIERRTGRAADLEEVGRVVAAELSALWGRWLVEKEGQEWPT